MTMAIERNEIEHLYRLLTPKYPVEMATVEQPVELCNERPSELQ
jgi:hypothetical protein